MCWTTGDRTIVAAFNSSDDPHFKTIYYEFDASTLDTVRTPFKGHTNLIANLALSYDCTLLVSGSWDLTVKPSSPANYLLHSTCLPRILSLRPTHAK